MTLVSQGKPINGVLCVVPSASSGSAWYALFSLLWWVQGVAPATSTRVGWLEQQCMDPSTAEPRSRVSSPWPHLIPRHKLVNLFPKGEWHPFLYKLSDLIYYLTQFHLLWNPIPPYLRQSCWHLFYDGRGPPIHNFTEKSCGTMGSSWVWAAPSEASPPRSSQHLRSTWRVSLHVRLVPSTIPELWGLDVVCNVHLMFKVLLTCYTKSAMTAGPLSDPTLVGNPNLGTISLSKHQATFDTLSVQVGKASTREECTHPKNIHTMTNK